MNSTVFLSASLEDYLEAIFHIVKEKQAARAKDIAERLKVKGASVTGALRSLAEKKLINYAPYDIITLTSEGRKIAEEIVRRHEVLKEFFLNVLALEEEEAEECACKVEHVISPAALEKLVCFLQFIEVCPRGGKKWIRGFWYQCEHGQTIDNCEHCVELCLEELRDKNKKMKGGKGMVIPLTALKPNSKGRIVKIKGRGEANKRIVDMGITPGALVEVERVAPLGDPIEVKIKGYHLSLRKEEASNIDVELQI